MDELRPHDLKYSRSAPGKTKSFARFYNNTRYPATLVWIDCEGKGVIYAEGLAPQRWLDVNTYAGHKWVFIKTGTDERLLANKKVIWIGEPWTNHTCSDQNMAKRIIVTIDKPLYTLRELCVTTIKNLLPPNTDSSSLSLPLCIKEDLDNSFFRYLMPFRNTPTLQQAR